MHLMWNVVMGGHFTKLVKLDLLYSSWYSILKFLFLLQIYCLHMSNSRAETITLICVGAPFPLRYHVINKLLTSTL